MPSFLAPVEGATINSLEYEYEDYFSIIPKKNLMSFKVFVVGEKEIYGFGKISELLN